MKSNSSNPKDKIKVVTINGNLMPLKDAKVSITAPGLSYAALVFEGIRAYWNKEHKQLYIFRLDEHLKRFINSMKLLKFIDYPNLSSIKADILQNIQANNYQEDIYIRLQGYIDEWGEMAVRSPVSTSIVSYPRPRAIAFTEGKNFTISSWQRLDDNASPPRIKASANYLNSRLASIQAKESGYDGGIMLGPNGKVSEGPGGCIFLIRNGNLITPTITSGILESITRDSIIEIADEIFYCGTGQEIMPILSVDKMLAGDGTPGKTTKTLQSEFTEIVRGNNQIFKSWISPTYKK